MLVTKEQIRDAENLLRSKYTGQALVILDQMPPDDIKAAWILAGVRLADSARIAELEAENARLKAALGAIVTVWAVNGIHEIARAALNPGK